MWINSGNRGLEKKMDELIEQQKRLNRPDVQIAHINEKLVTISERQIEILKKLEGHSDRLITVEKVSWKFTEFEKTMKRVMWLIVGAIFTGLATTWDKIHKIFQ